MKLLDALAWVFMFLISALWLGKHEFWALRAAWFATAIYFTLVVKALLRR